MPNLIAFDADNTLGENEIHFETAKDRIAHLGELPDLFAARFASTVQD